MARTVLIVDDEEVVGDLIADVLRHQGLVPRLARSIDDAMAAWETEREGIRLLIADLHLGGGVNGMELAERLVREKPELKVIFTSGFPVTEEHGLLFVEGENFLKKPFRLPMLIEAVRKALT